MKFDV